MNNVLDRLIKDTTLPTRAKTVLKRLEAKTVGDATKLTRSQLLKTKWCGKKVANYIENFLTGLGLSLSDGGVVNAEPGFPLLNSFFNIQKQLFDYFGYSEDWVKIPLDDATDSYWMLQQNEHGGGLVKYSQKPLTLEILTDGSELYGASIYTQRFLPKWVYRGEKYTMIVVDTHTDGNKFLSIFDNSKEVEVTPELAAASRRWDLFGDLGTPLDMLPGAVNDPQRGFIDEGSPSHSFKVVEK